MNQKFESNVTQRREISLIFPWQSYCSSRGVNEHNQVKHSNVQVCLILLSKFETLFKFGLFIYESKNELLSSQLRAELK